jgi:hypothetical protein
VQALRELFGLDTEKLSAFDAQRGDGGAATAEQDLPTADVTSIRSRRRRNR